MKSSSGLQSLSNQARDALLADAWIEAQKRVEGRRNAQAAPDDWHGWLKTIFPQYVTKPFGDRHIALWKWVWSLDASTKPRPFAGFWPRESGKSTTVELATAALGARGIKKYVWYVRETQDQADKSVQNIEGLLSGSTFERYYPDCSSPALTKTGNTRGWNRNILRAANDFNVEAIGLNRASRGGKLDWVRPDLIIFDDVDGKHDTSDTTRKKEEIITTSLLPAGAQHCAVMFMQNLIIPDGIASRLANVSDNSADYLIDRIISGPFPAIEGLEYEQRKDDEGIKRFFITGGTATWEGQSLEVCQRNIDTWGLTAFLQEAQHDVDVRFGDMWAHIDFERIVWDDLPEIKRKAIWVDPAVTEKDSSDSHAIQADALGVDGKIYRLFSWEKRSSPEASLRTALVKAVELGIGTVGVETDQGGNTWISVYERAWSALVDDDNVSTITASTPKPKFRQAKAGSGHGGKVERNQRMLVDYEHGRVVHVEGTHRVLEKALYRFPTFKPFDLADAGYWSWADLRNRINRLRSSGSSGRV